MNRQRSHVLRGTSTPCRASTRRRAASGNVTRVALPDGSTITFTGMKVLKHDGSRHHGIGILPTVPVSPTLAGVRAGRDEILEAALDLVAH